MTKKYTLKTHLEINPMIKIIRKNKIGWQIGNITILLPNKNKNLRNIICKELGIKKFAFNSKSIYKKNKIKNQNRSCISLKGG